MSEENSKPVEKESYQPNEIRGFAEFYLEIKRLEKKVEEGIKKWRRLSEKDTPYSNFDLVHSAEELIRYIRVNQSKIPENVETALFYKGALEAEIDRNRTYITDSCKSKDFRSILK